MTRRRARLITRLSLLAGLGACQSPPPGPVDTLDAYLAAVETGDAAAAYALMGQEYRSRVDATAFAARFEAHRDAALARLSAAQERGWGEPELIADLDTGAGLPVRLRRVSGRWLIADGILDEYAQDTPRRTLVSFVRALERERWDVLLRFVPRALRGDLDEAGLRDYVLSEAADVGTLLERLRRHLDAPIEQEGDRAVMRYEGFEFELAWEEGAWRVLDPD